MTGCHQPAERIVTGHRDPGRVVRAGGCASSTSRGRTRSKEVAFYMPDVPQGSQRVQSNDVTVDERGLIYLLDRVRGLHILERIG